VKCPQAVSNYIAHTHRQRENRLPSATNLWQRHSK